jgi:hypothetical protein
MYFVAKNTTGIFPQAKGKKYKRMGLNVILVEYKCTITEVEGKLR